jgi:hypothetical protein
MCSDSGWGFLVWDSMQRGASFNFAVVPDPANISRDVAAFNTVWSPGQYWFPGVMERFGLSLGHAISLTTAAFSMLGLAGWHELYTGFGFPRRTVATAMIASARFFGLPFGIYDGGEVLLFGVAPWFALVLWKLRTLRWHHMPLLLSGMLVLFFAKLSGVPLAAAMLPAAVLAPQQPWLSRDTFRKAAIVGTTIVLFGVVFYLAWYSRGWTAASSGAHRLQWPLIVSYLGFLLTAVWSSSLSLGDLASYIFLHPSQPLPSSLDAINIALLPFAVATFVFVWVRLKDGHADYRLFVLLAAGAYVAMLALIFLRGGAVSLDERHFRPVSLLLLVGIVHAFSEQPSRPARAVFGAAAVGFALYGLASFAVHVVQTCSNRLACAASDCRSRRRWRLWIF